MLHKRMFALFLSAILGWNEKFENQSIVIEGYIKEQVVGICSEIKLESKSEQKDGVFFSFFLFSIVDPSVSNTFITIIFQ